MEVRFCPRCGTERWPGAMFCGKCAYAFGGLPASVPPAGAPSAPQRAPQEPAPIDPTPAPPPEPQANPPAVAAAPVDAIVARRPGERLAVSADPTQVTDDTVAVELPAAGATVAPPAQAAALIAAPRGDSVPTASWAPAEPTPGSAGALAVSPSSAGSIPWAAEPAPPDWQPSAALSLATAPRRGRSRRLSSATALFGFLALGLVVAATLLLALGLPRPGSGFEPITGADLTTRLHQVLPLGAAVLAALIGMVVAAASAAGAVPRSGGVVLLVLAGLVVLAMAALLVSAAAWDSAGAVLPGISLLIAGGVGLVAAAALGALNDD